MVCEKCGSEIREGNRFCGVCGAQIPEKQREDNAGRKRSADRKKRGESGRKRFPVKQAVIAAGLVACVAAGVVLYQSQRGGDIRYTKVPGEYSGGIMDEDSGLIRVWRGTIGVRATYGYIDREGKEVIPLIYDGAFNFSEGLARVAIEDSGKEKCGYIDTTGKDKSLYRTYLRSFRRN